MNSNTPSAVPTRALIKRYEPGEREQSVLDAVQDPKYDRGIVSGLSPFIGDTAPDEYKGLYTPVEIKSLQDIKGSERDVEDRMPVKITRHYLELAKSSAALQRLVKASPEETLDLEGDPDPAGQMNYSPVEGLLHKYEMALLYVVSTCSAHCRFCYREELIARKEVERSDGEAKKKGMAKIAEVVAYIKEHNDAVDGNGGAHPVTGRPHLREVLLSGGDPMVLPNSRIAGWMTALAEAGIRSIRIGTKEISFCPERLDGAFFAMLDSFHEAYPHVTLRFMTHFSHPDEILKKDDGGGYITDRTGKPEWIETTRAAVDGLRSRIWVGMENQTPIIKGVNDDADALRSLQRELKAAGVQNHYFFCGRDIIGYRAFNVPMEEAWELLMESQRGLSGVEAQARLSGSHYLGKIEVVSVSDSPMDGAPNGTVVFRLIRSPADASGKGSIGIARRNPEALWFDDYSDRVIVDEPGMFKGRPGL